jgi:hypothetical protein
MSVPFVGGLVSRLVDAATTASLVCDAIRARRSGRRLPGSAQVGGVAAVTGS